MAEQVSGSDGPVVQGVKRAMQMGRCVGVVAVNYSSECYNIVVNYRGVG